MSSEVKYVGRETTRLSFLEAGVRLIEVATVARYALLAINSNSVPVEAGYTLVTLLKYFDHNMENYRDDFLAHLYSEAQDPELVMPSGSDSLNQSQWLAELYEGYRNDPRAKARLLLRNATILDPELGIDVFACELRLINRIHIILGEFGSVPVDPRISEAIFKLLNTCVLESHHEDQPTDNRQQFIEAAGIVLAGTTS